MVTLGGRQSNHCRQTAAAAARLGLRCTVVLEPGRSEDEEHRESGNVLLARLAGARIVVPEPGADATDTAAAVLADLERNGERPHLVPVGGSTPLGALGYVRCAEEVLAAGTRFSTVILATGSGGTQAGLLAGFHRHGEPVVVVGVSVSEAAEVQRRKVHALAAGTSALLGADAARGVRLEDVLVDDRHVGPGYGYPTDAMREAVELLARTEGVLLDPVYTGKAMAGLVHAVRRSKEAIVPGTDVLFLHTGGQAGLFAQRDALSGG